MDIEQLDITRTYVGLQYGNSAIAKRIAKHTKQYAPDSPLIPTHVMAMVFRLGEWWVYESHLKAHKKLGIPSGVRRYKLSTWLKIEKVNEFKFYPIKVSLKSLEEYIGLPYGVGDIKNLLKASIFKNNGKQKDKFGLICSEYIALCMPSIRQYLQLSAWCITPAHFQKYFDEIGIEAIE